MQKTVITLLTIVLPLLPVSGSFGEEARQSFSVRAADISGHFTGAVSLSGGGAYDLASSFLHAGGSFKCTGDVVDGPLGLTGPLKSVGGCQAGQSGRWVGFEILKDSNFRCIGQKTDPLEPQGKVTTGDKAVAMHAWFFLLGKPVHRPTDPIQVRMWVSQVDESPTYPGHPGTQNVWIQGVGCGNAITTFN